MSPPTSRPRRWPWWIGAVVLIFFCLLLIAPYFFSKRPAFISHWLSERFHGHFTVRAFEFRWLGPQKVSGLTFKGAEGHIELTVETVEIRRSLLSLLFQKEAGSLLIAKPNLIWTPASTQEKTPPPMFWIPAQEVAVEGGRIAVILDSNSSQIDDISLLWHVDKDLHCQGITTAEEKRGSFLCDMKRDGEDHLTCEASQVPLMPLHAIFATVYPTLAPLAMDGLGDWLSGHLTFRGSSSTFTLEATVSTPLISANLTTENTPHGLAINIDTPWQWTLTPSFFRDLLSFLPYPVALHLQESTTLAATFKDVVCPRIDGRLRWDHLKGEMQVFFHEGVLSLPKENLLVHHLGLSTFSTQKLSDAFHFDYQSTLEGGSIECSVDLFPTVLSSKAKERFFANLNILIQGLPLALVGELSHLPHLVSYLGPTCDLAIAGLKDKEAIECRFHTPYLNLEPMVFSVDEIAYLQFPVNYTYHPQTTIALPHVGFFHSIVGSVDLIGFPMNPWAGDVQSLMLQMSANILGMHIEHLDALGKVVLSAPSLEINATAFSAIHCRSAAQLTFPNPNSLGHLLCGTQLAFTFDSTWNLSDFSNIGVPEIDIQLQSDQVKGQIHAAIEDNFTLFKLTAPLEFELLPAPLFITRLFGIDHPTVFYAPYTPLTLRAGPTVYRRVPPYIKSLDITLEGSLPELAVVNAEWAPPLFIFKETLFKIYSKMGELDLEAEIQTKAYKDHHVLGKLSAGLHTEDLTTIDLEKVNFFGNLDLHEFATEALDDLFNISFFSHVIGKVVTCDIQLLNTVPNMDWHVKAHSPQLTLQGDFATTPDRVTLGQAPLEMTFALTDSSYTALKRYFAKSDALDAIHVAKEGKFTLELTALTLPIHEKQCLWSDLTFSGEVTAEPFGLSNGSSVVLVDSLAITGRGKENSPAIDMHLTTKWREGDKRSEKGAMQLTYSPAGVDLSLSHVPTLLFDGTLPFFFSVKHPFEPLIGHDISGSAAIEHKSQSEGVTFNLVSQYLTASLQGEMQEHHFHLTQPFDMRLEVTQGLGHLLLDDFNMTFVSSQTPIHFIVAPQGTDVNWPPTFAQMTVPHFHLNLGKILCASTGSSHDLGTLLKLKFSDTTLFSFWFATLDGSLMDGILSMERTEILFNDQYQIAVWGQVNFLTQMIDMSVGLTASCLNKAFGIDGLQSTFVLTIPLKGSFKKVRLGLDVATAKLALLFAAQEGLKPKGAWGGVVDIAREIANDQSEVPPAKHPFPWEQGAAH